MDAKELIEKSQNIAVVLHPQAEQMDMQTAQTLVCGLRKLGKNVMLAEQDIGKQYFSSPHDGSPAGKTFAVSLKGLAPWISRVYYEKSERDLKLYFTLQQGEVSPQNLSLQIQNQSDLIIIVGEKQPQHNTLPRNSFQAALSGQEAKQAVLELLSFRENAPSRLLARVLAKLEPSWSSGLYMAYMERRDFQEHATGPKALIGVVSDLREHFGEHYSFLLLYESLAGFGTQGVLWSANNALRKKLLQQQKGEEKGNWLLFSASATEAHEVKRRLRFLS